MAQMDSNAARRRMVALAWGVATHGAFVLGVAAMAWSLHAGLHPWGGGLGEAGGPVAWLVDLALLAQFPLLHSWLLSKDARPAWLVRAVLGSKGGVLGTSRFVIVSALRLLLAFTLWQPLSTTAWRPTGAFLVAHEAAFALAWILLVVAMREAGLSVQTGSLGWTSLWKGAAPRFPAFRPIGLHALVRHPIYVAFTLVLWTAPTWTLDRFVLGGVWTVYCVLGARRKEARLLERHGAVWEEHAARTPFFVPGLRPRPVPARSLESAVAPRMLSAPAPTSGDRGACASSS